MRRNGKNPVGKVRRKLARFSLGKRGGTGGKSIDGVGETRLTKKRSIRKNESGNSANLRSLQGFGKIRGNPIKKSEKKNPDAAAGEARD